MFVPVLIISRSMKASRNIYNWLSLTGFIIVINSLLLILALFLFSLFSRENNTYLGLYIYIILPVFLIIGLLLIPLGILIRIRKKEPSDELQGVWPMLDLNQKKQRTGLVKIVIISALIIVTSAIGSYKAYMITESVEFCGKVCHKVMEPEFTTHQHSPHARVTCVECHVGEGADWFVKSKLSGLYQIYSVIYHKYSRPIATPIHQLRPVPETCERCHWPEKFYARKLLSRRSYLSDSANTEWYNSLVLKIGPEFDSTGLTKGIHWHISKNFRIEYIASTPDRETIPWIKLTDLTTGEVKIFNDAKNPVSGKELEKYEVRTMDCMDCHNRASHRFISPNIYVDKALSAGKIPKDIPFIKKAAMQALKYTYSSLDSALVSIDKNITDFYREKHPKLYATELNRINIAIRVIQDEYKSNTFPYMRADASKYPNHLEHIESDGCFRCHSDRHKTARGETISRNCDLCHTINAQGISGKITEGSIRGSLKYIHPVEIKGRWKTEACSECHRTLYE